MSWRKGPPRRHYLPLLQPHTAPMRPAASQRLFALTLFLWVAFMLTTLAWPTNIPTQTSRQSEPLKASKPSKEIPPDTHGFSSTPLPPVFELHRAPRLSPVDFAALGLAFSEAFALTSHSRPTCQFLDWHHARYASLRRSNSTIFLALNLQNSAEILPTLIQELPSILEFLGPHRVHVSVYENGSEDETPQFLVLRMSC